VFSKKYDKIFKSEPVDVITFHHEFLKRFPSPKQTEFLIAACGTDPLIFDMTYDELVLMVGQKGGKNWIVEGYIAYCAYQLSNLYDPHRYLNIDDRMTNFDFANSSLVNEVQAKNVFFNRLKQVLRATIDPATGNNWFEQYLNMDLRPGGFGNIKTKTIEFPGNEDRGKIIMHSFDSTPESPEGLKLWRHIIDEPSRANTLILFNSAEHLHRVGRGNIAGSFPNGLGKLLIFSYPEQKVNDLTVKRYEEAKDEPTTFRMKATTWEFNPTQRKENFEKFYKDPIDALCRFECVVPESKFGFFAPYFDKIRECINPLLSNRVKFKPSLTVRETKEGDKTNIHKFTSVEILEIKGDNRIRVVTADNAVSDNSFIVGCGYAEFDEQEEGKPKTVTIRKNIGGLDTIEEIPLNGIVIFDTVIVWRPDSKHPVDYENVEDVVMLLFDTFPNVVGMHSDKFNSESLRQKVMSKKGIEYKTYYFSNPQQVRIYTVLRGLIWNNMAEFLSKEEYISSTKDPNIEDELRQLLFENKTKIDHPANGSKDLSDNFALLAYHALLTEYVPRPRFDSMPDNMLSLDEYVRRYRAAKDNLKMALRREPTIEEIAKHLGETVAWLEEIIDYASDSYYHDKTLGNVLPEGTMTEEL